MVMVTLFCQFSFAKEQLLQIKHDPLVTLFFDQLKHVRLRLFETDEQDLNICIHARYLGGRVLYTPVSY